eukprot:CAMPEP_0115291902 /NCGR_PEP_ID=MMETSP0270-20121206/64850_1 /TAXON_ID=71861 /ORGANISM="Scrippsiella trochoidea, Strain CCMP3099" /LENGTH=192 /DNA_ID=CAMNT_0002709299 /DNA_START=575 /DNA_END=1150 /DNA_ORIENTATION=+
MRLPSPPNRTGMQTTAATVKSHGKTSLALSAGNMAIKANCMEASRKPKPLQTTTCIAFLLRPTANHNEQLRNCMQHCAGGRSSELLSLTTCFKSASGAAKRQMQMIIANKPEQQRPCGSQRCAASPSRRGDLPKDHVAPAEEEIAAASQKPQQVPRHDRPHRREDAPNHPKRSIEKHQDHRLGADGSEGCTL